MSLAVIEWGSDRRLGAHFDGRGTNFVLQAPDADWVELCLFDAEGVETRHRLPGRSGACHHGYLAGVAPGQRYAFRVHGRWAPDQGLRFNPAKLLIDPCALALVGEVLDDPRLEDGAASPDPRDSAPCVPRCLVIDTGFDWGSDRPPRVPWSDTLIYEAHVRGLTQSFPGLEPKLRGSYAALGEAAVIAHLKRLGVTTLELLPVQHGIDEPRLRRLGLSNYWGYNVLAPFALDPRHACGRGGLSPLDEFRLAVRALHTAGIEVILDVVFNHSAELDAEGPILSLRGIDNRHAYWLDQRAAPCDWSGCGNALRLDHGEAVRWVMECLRGWVELCHVDGFRFDLGVALGRTPEFTALAPLLSAIRQDPVLSACKLITEPWDLGPDGYRLGGFPFPFSEWNDRFRDAVRRFWLTGDIARDEFATRLAGSSDFFDHHGRAPWTSINLLTSHDGFTLHDLLCFDQRHNQDNGEQGRDGHGDNFSANHGVEGYTADAATAEARDRSRRALLSTLLLAHGTPMLLGGDEFANGQSGNNNAYCQDNPIGWLDWPERPPALIDWLAAMVRLRGELADARGRDWWHPDQVAWFDGDGSVMSAEAWRDPAGETLQLSLGERALLIFHRGVASIPLTVPPMWQARRWRVASACEALLEDEDDAWRVPPRAVVVLLSMD